MGYPVSRLTFTAKFSWVYGLLISGYPFFLLLFPESLFQLDSRHVGPNSLSTYGIPIFPFFKTTCLEVIFLTDVSQILLCKPANANRLEHLRLRPNFLYFLSTSCAVRLHLPGSSASTLFQQQCCSSCDIAGEKEKGSHCSLKDALNCFPSKNHERPLQKTYNPPKKPQTSPETL